MLGINTTTPNQYVLQRQAQSVVPVTPQVITQKEVEGKKPEDEVSEIDSSHTQEDGSNGKQQGQEQYRNSRHALEMLRQQRPDSGDTRGDIDAYRRYEEGMKMVQERHRLDVEA